MALKGNLRDFSTPQLLNLINLARKTGTLTIEHGNKAQMSFREGKLIHASMGEKNGTLAHVLQRSGKLSIDQATIIQKKAGGLSDKQLGHLLIQAGFVTQSDIIQSVRQYVLDIVYKLFAWAEGLFRFEANQLPSVNRITIPIDLESVIMEGSRRMKEWEVLKEEIPSLDATLRFADRPNARLRNINLTVEEWRVVSFVNPRNSIRQIARANNLSDFEIRRIVYGMLQAGLVEFTEPKKQIKRAPQPSNQKERGSKPPEPSPAAKRSIVMRLIDKIRGL